MNVHSVHVTMKQPWKQSDSRFSLHNTQHKIHNTQGNEVMEQYETTEIYNTAKWKNASLGGAN